MSYMRFSLSHKPNSAVVSGAWSYFCKNIFRFRFFPRLETPSKNTYIFTPHFLGENNLDASAVSEEDLVQNGFGLFSIDLPHQGLVTVQKQLDYETSKIHYVTIVASVR